MAHKQVLFRSAAREKVLTEATMTEVPEPLPTSPAMSEGM